MERVWAAATGASSPSYRTTPSTITRTTSAPLPAKTAASGPAIVGAPNEPGFGQLLQGYTESSNVDAVSEISALIVAQRAYEMNSKVISTADQMLSVASQVKG